MKKSQTELTYMRTAAQNASPAGLVVILYDLLVHDLEQAITAFAERNIETRTKEIKHAFLVLQQLEGSLDMEQGGESAQHLSRFYSALRRNILQAQIKADPGILRKQIDLVLDVRQAWQQIDKPNLASATGPVASDRAAAAAAGSGEAGPSNWTA
jgi:flagellar protein FliS